MTRVEKPWGWELWWAHTERYVGKILHVKKGAALSYQFHRKKDETVYLLRGELAVELAPQGRRRRRWVMRSGEALRIRPGDHHRMTAVTACDVLEASTPEVEDVVRLEDRYGRAGAVAPGTGKRGGTRQGNRSLTRCDGRARSRPRER